jgi:hypothetical protein
LKELLGIPPWGWVGRVATAGLGILLAAYFYWSTGGSAEVDTSQRVKLLDSVLVDAGEQSLDVRLSMEGLDFRAVSITATSASITLAFRVAIGYEVGLDGSPTTCMIGRPVASNSYLMDAFGNRYVLRNSKTDLPNQ